EAEPGAVTERHEAGMADEDVEAHAGNGEHHHVDRRAQRQSCDIEHAGQQDEGERGDDERSMIPAHRSPTRTSRCARRTVRVAAAAAPAPATGTARLRPTTG